MVLLTLIQRGKYLTQFQKTMKALTVVSFYIPNH